MYVYGQRFVEGCSGERRLGLVYLCLVDPTHLGTAADLTRMEFTVFLVILLRTGMFVK